MVYERNAGQSGSNRNKKAETNDELGSKAPIEAFLAEHRAVVEEYADGDYSTAWLHEALLSWDERDGQGNGVSEQ